MRKLFLFLFVVLLFQSNAQLNADFIVPAELCLEEVIDISNTSTGAVDYTWDFCANDFVFAASGQLKTSSSLFDGSFDIELSNDTEGWYGFITNRNTELIYRISYGDSLRSAIDEVEAMPQLSGMVDPYGISIYEYEGNWYGHSVSLADNKLAFYEFGDSLSKMPTISSIEDVGMYEGNNDVTSQVIGDSAYVFVSSDEAGALLRLRYSVLTPEIMLTDTIELSGYNEVTDLKLIRDCDGWYGLISSISDSKVSRLSFGTSLRLPPTEEEITGFSFTQATKLTLVPEGAEFYGFVQLRFGDLVRIDFGESMSGTWSIENLGDFGLFSSNSFGFAMGKDGSEWTGYGSGFSENNLYQVNYGSECLSNIAVSELEEPEGVSYTGSGRQYITLTARDSEGNLSYYLDSVDVSVDLAPSIGFTIDASRCISVTNTFTPSVTGLTSYSWDFNNDGVEDSNLENPEVSFDTLGGPGTYTIRLDVNDGTCSNFIEQDITIYPEPPVPSFEIATLGTFCTDNELMLTNTTDESGYDDVLSYQWVIDGDSVDQRDTVYAFDSQGDKTITLQSFLPGCSSLVTSETINIGEGVGVSFSYSNNCFGESIMFTSEVTGVVEGETLVYLWDFGDSAGMSMEANPSYEYGSGGEYEVVLSVTNELGCETIYQETLVVNAMSLVGFAVGEAVENLPVTFSGHDLTLMLDSIVSWSWDFGGLGTSNSQDTTFTFSGGSYTVDLRIETAQGCTETISQEVLIDESTCPTLSFMIPENVCQGEALDVANTSVNASEYSWDFCSNDFVFVASGQLKTSSSLFAGSFDIELSNDSEGWYGFITNRDTESVYRISYGDSLRSAIDEVEAMPQLSGMVDPYGISIYEYEGNWYGHSVSLADNKLAFYEFGDSLSKMPTISSIEDVGMYEGNNDVTSQVIGDSAYVFVSSDEAGALLRLRYSVLTPEIMLTDTIELSGYNEVTDLKLIRDCDGWYGLISSISDSKVSRLSFGTSLRLPPTEEEITGFSFTQATKLTLVPEGAEFYGFVQLRFGDLVRIDFGESMSGTWSIENLGDFGLFSSNSFGFAMGKDGSEWTGYGSGFSENNLYQVNYGSECLSNIAVSELEEPEGVSYTGSGRQYITLTARDSEGNLSYYLDSVDVSVDLAPSIGFTIDASRCISVTNTFTPSVTGLTSYSWDFNGDGIEDSNAEEPLFDYSTLGAGIYTVRLDVNDGTCSNFIEQDITIYPEPPVPVVVASETAQCLNTEISFTNTTDESQHIGIISYAWDFDNDGLIDSTEPSPSISFDTPGDRVVSVTSSIPGCESEATTIEITVLEGPTANFNSAIVCDGDAVSFTNTSSNAFSYLWDFSDGVTSTNENPSHLFPDAGNYFVELIATDINGCEDTQVVEVVVLDNPEVAFDFGIPCTDDDGVQFLDESSGGIDADPVSWSWRIDGEEVSTDQNPVFNFSQGGLVDVALAVTNSNGCESLYSEELEILDAPVPDFTSQINCVGEASHFQDVTSTELNPINGWLWDVNGTTYTDQNISHVFDSPGQYEVTLEVTSQNTCSESITQIVEVLQLPEVNFSAIGDCDNVTITAIDNSTEFDDAIISRRWMLDDTDVGNGSEIVLEQLDEGSYNLMLEAETAQGCLVSSVQQIVVNSSPTASFTFDKFYGIPGDQITFTNTSEGGSAVSWLINGQSIDESFEQQFFVFDEVGDYQVGLVSTSDLGCSDTITQNVIIRIPEVDLEITNFDLLEENNVGRVLVQISNQSNLPIDLIDVEINLENQFSVTERISQFIDTGQEELISLNTRIPLEVSHPSYFCVNVQSQYTQYPDLNPLNDEKCTTIDPEIVVEDPFPNPVVDRFRVRMVVPNSGTTTVRVLNSSGKQEMVEVRETVQGLNNLFIDMSALNSGIYFIRVGVGDQEFRKKIIKL